MHEGPQDLSVAEAVFFLPESLSSPGGVDDVLPHLSSERGAVPRGARIMVVPPHSACAPRGVVPEAPPP